MSEQSHVKPALVVFLMAAGLLSFLFSDRLRLNIDEGMYLDGALRSYGGETLYRDFLVHTGPGTFWLCEAAFRLLGVSLSHARIPLVLGLAAMVTGVFYLTAVLTSLEFAFGVTFLFLLAQTNDLYLVAVNHRWDSGAFAFIAVVAGFFAIRRGSRWFSFCAGICAAAAAWATPTVGVVAVPLVCWMLFHRNLRRLAPGFIAGGALLSAACIAILAAKGALGPMIHHFLWTGSNYSAPNRVPYGFSGTGFAEARSGLGLGGKIVFSFVLACLLLPAILPPLAYLGWAAWFAVRRATRQSQPGDIVFLLLCSSALFVSTYPRWDRGHLLYVTPIFYVLVAALVYRAIPRRMFAPVFALFSAVLAFLWWQPLLDARNFAPMNTPSGSLSVRPEDRAFVDSLLRHVHPGDSLFVFPNFPTVYFLTRGVNPSRFSFLQAGLMTGEDEQAAIRDLKAKPPKWVLYWDVPPERYLKTSPSADPARLRFPVMEEYLKANYHKVEVRNHWHGEYAVLERVER